MYSILKYTKYPRYFARHSHPLCIHLCYLNTDVTEELLITENTYPVIVVCLDGSTKVNNYPFPDPKDTLMVKFLADRSNLSDLEIKKYINTIELMDDEN